MIFYGVFVLFFCKVRIKCVYSFFLNTVLYVHHDNFQWGWTGAGWTDGGSCSSWHQTGITGPERFVDGREEHLLVLCLLMGDTFFIDAGTRVHLLDAKGLSFTQNVLICICYGLEYIWNLGPILRYTGLLCLESTCFCLFQAHCVCETVWTASPPYVVNSVNWTKSADLQL